MPCCCSRCLRVAPRVAALAGGPDREGERQGGDRGHPEPEVLARCRRATTVERDLEPERHDDLDPERRVARVAEHRHAAAAQVHRHPGDHRDGEDDGEERRATVHEPHQGVRQGEARHEVHAQQVEVAAEVALGRVHRHRARPEQHDEHGVGRRETRVGTQGDAQAGALPGVPGDGQPGDDEAEVAPGVGGLADPPGAGRLAEAVAAADVRAEPAPAGGGHHEGQGDDGGHRGDDQGSQVAPARRRASSRRQPHHRARCGATGQR